MTTPTYNSAFVPPEIQTFYWGEELAAAGTLAATLYQEEFDSFSWAPQRNPWVNNLKTGFPSTRQGTVETTHHAQITLRVPAHPGGLAAYCAAKLAGDVANTGAADTITGTGDPYTHTVVPGPTGTRCNTISLVWNTGASSSNPAYQFLYCTVQDVKFSGGSDAVLMADITLLAMYPTEVAKPSGATWLAPNTYTFGYESVFTIKANNGSTYSAKIISGDITLSRQLAVVPSFNNGGSQSPIDIYPKDLMLAASVGMIYDGTGAGHAASDFLGYLKAGTYTTPNIISWADTNSPQHSIAFQFAPAVWDTAVPSEGDGYLVINGTLTSEQDFSKATQSSPAWSLLKQMVFVNAQAAAMVH